MSDGTLNVENPFRPIYELYSVAGWAAAAALMGLSAYLSAYPSTPFLAFGGFSLAMAALRAPRVVSLFKTHKRLNGAPLSFMTREELREICRKRPDAIFLGYGFPWSQSQRQLVHTITRNDPEKLAPRGDGNMGQGWMHGLGNEEPIFLPMDHNAGHMLLAGTTRAGKALPLAAKVHTPAGWITMADVKVGTLVSTPDGGVAQVSGVFPQGALETFHLYFNDGRVVEASGDHLWAIHHTPWRPGEPPACKAVTRVLTTLEIRAQQRKDKGSFCVPFTRPVAKPHADLPVPPYVLGVLLAAGLKSSVDRLTVTSEDPEIIGRLAAELPWGFAFQRASAQQSGDSLVATPALRRSLVDLGLKECQRRDALIPEVYLGASIEQRTALLQGLMDTHGTVSTRGTASMTAVSHRLARDIQTLVWSLGGAATLRPRATPKNAKQGARPTYALSLELENLRTAFSLARKIARCPSTTEQKSRAGLAITRIVPARTTECQCIKVDHPDELFITDDYVVTHNTRLLDSLITQAVFRGEAVIVLDPKGDKELMECIRQACIADGRAEDFVYFHPAFPDQCWRIDPLRNFSRSTELASRIASLIPSETGADPFTAFGQMQLSHICDGILMINAKPTLRDILDYLEGGMPYLVVDAVQAYCRRTFEGKDWETNLQRFLEGCKPDIGAKAMAHARFYREWVVPRKRSGELEGLISSFTHDASHYGKMIASLLPVLTMLTSGVLGNLLSPDPKDLRDPRPITDFARMIRNKQVVYIGLDSLTDKFVGSAIGAMFLADLTAVAGDRYNYGAGLAPVNLYVDEAAEVVNDPFIAMLNKAGGALFRTTIATQTLGDFTARLGSDAKTRMVLGNLNNLVALRLIDGVTQEYITETFLETVVRHVEYSQSSKAETDEPFIFSGTMSEALKETEVPLVTAPMLGCLPNLEFFARVSGGRLVKVRSPILVSRPSNAVNEPPPRQDKKTAA